MRTRDLLPALAALATFGCAELASIAPSVTIDVVATQREDASGDAWSWGVGGRLGGTFDASAIAVVEGSRGPREIPSPIASRCEIAPICAWESRARASALVRARAMSLGEEP